MTVAPVAPVLAPEEVERLKVVIHVDRMSIGELLFFTDDGSDWRQKLEILDRVVEMTNGNGEAVDVKRLPVPELRPLVRKVVESINEGSDPGGSSGGGS